MKHIFISYSHQDSEFVEKLRSKLSSDYLVWSDQGISGGEDWRREIDQAIKDAFILTVVMTPEAQASEYVTYEWAFALGAGVKVVPILLKATKLHPRLESLQRLDFTNSRARAWGQLSTVLLDAAKPVIETMEPSPRYEISDDREKAAYGQMLAVFADEDYEWRSIAKLAAEAGIAENEAIGILRSNPSIVFGKSRAYGMVAKLNKARNVEKLKGTKSGVAIKSSNR